MNKAHPDSPNSSKTDTAAPPRGACPRALPHDPVRTLRTQPLPTLLPRFREAGDTAPFRCPPAPDHTPHGRIIRLGSRTPHSGTHVAIARFYGKCRVCSMIESRRHDGRHAAESDRKSIPSPNRMRAIHGHTLHSPKSARQLESARKPNAASCPHTLLAHHRANARAPEVTPFLKGRIPATSKQT